ncbi:22704_t:CDS:2 [Rhizophagus irregularis]|nr:22704_t:CDS:2 [Rhizophagus irregularis]
MEITPFVKRPGVGREGRPIKFRESIPGKSPWKRKGQYSTHGTFSFLAPHYRDFNNDVTFGEGDTFLDFATSSATSSATTNTAKQVKNHLGRKSQGIQKRQPIKKISYEEKFCCAKLAITSLEKTPDRFKSKLVTMRETSDEEATGSRVCCSNSLCINLSRIS